MRVVLKDVANHAQVSSATVSNYLNKPEVLSSETRERIAASIAELGYVPSDAARKLRKNEINTIGFIVFEIANPHFGAVADAVERRARQEGWKLLIGNTLGSKARELEYLELFESQRIGGEWIYLFGEVVRLLYFRWNQLSVTKFYIWQRITFAIRNYWSIWVLCT